MIKTYKAVHLQEFLAQNAKCRSIGPASVDFGRFARRERVLSIVSIYSQYHTWRTHALHPYHTLSDISFLYSLPRLEGTNAPNPCVILQKAIGCHSIDQKTIQIQKSLLTAGAMVTIQVLETVAAMSPPPGQVSNLEDPPNTLWTFNVLAVTACMIVAGILFAMRCFVRLGGGRLERQWNTEDWFVSLSFMGLCAYCGLMGLMMNSHAGVHQWDLTPSQAHKILYYFWIETIIYGFFIFCTKFSILLMYLRLLIPTRWSPLWTIIHIFVGTSAFFYAAITFAKAFQCHPISRTWNKSVPGTCINLGVLLEMTGLYNTISDALILLVPIKAVWSLKMSWKKKLGVCGVFTIGAIAPIFSAIGFAARIETASSHDSTYNQPVILLWGTAEVTTGVICACLPCLPPLFRRAPDPSAVQSSLTYNRQSQAKLDHEKNDRHNYRCKAYHELGEIIHNGSNTAIITTVQAASRTESLHNNEENVSTPRLWGSSLLPEEWIQLERWGAEEKQRRRRADHGGIMRTVKIEQSDE